MNFQAGRISIEIPPLDGALCPQTDPDKFYPEHAKRTIDQREAKKVCASCDVSAQCLEWALEHDERFGIWGGTTPQERNKIARQREQS